MKKALLTILILVISGLVQAVNLLPQANLKVSDYRVELGQEVVLDASDSLNPQGQRYRLQYRFKPNAREPWSQLSPTPIFRYKPQKTGNETAYLQVIDTERGYRNISTRNYRVIEPQNKSARIVILNQDPLHVGEEVFFQMVYNVPSNTDTQNIYVRWDFDSDGNFDTGFTNIQTVSYVFSEAKSMRPKAQVIFPNGEKLMVNGIQPTTDFRSRKRLTTRDFKKIKIAPPKINAPTVNLIPSYRVYDENTAIKFDASKTQTNATSWIEFQFDGQSVITDKQIVTKKFKSPGNHIVITRHCYNRSNPICAETTTTVYVRPNPTDFSVKFYVYDLNGYSPSQNTGPNKNFHRFSVGKRLRFQANVQHLSNAGTYFEYRWDFDGDGKFDTPFSHKNYVEHLYARPGNYKVCVQVKNEFTREDHQLVSNHKLLKIVNNQAPYGYFKIQKLSRNPNQKGKKAKLFVGDIAQITPVVNDPDNYKQSVKIRFDIDGDGRWETDFTYNGGFQWQFVDSGDFTATMQIMDNNGIVKTIHQTYTVFQNDTPKIKVTVSKKQVSVGETVAFNAAKSDGNGLLFDWDIPENYSPKNSILAQTTARFKTPGKKMIGLTITNSVGVSKWVQFPVWVK